MLLAFRFGRWKKSIIAHRNLYITFFIPPEMEKDIDRIEKNPDTEIVIRIDDFGGRVGLTIREFVKSDRYTGFTKAGTRIPAEKFKQFKDAINSIDEAELEKAVSDTQEKQNSEQATLESQQSQAEQTQTEQTPDTQETPEEQAI